MTQKQRRWFAAPMLNRDGSPDRLKRWNVLEHSEARGKTVIAMQIRSEDKAHLIAAAPELLKALKLALDPKTAGQSETWNIGRAAIAEAEGKL